MTVIVKQKLSGIENLESSLENNLPTLKYTGNLCPNCWQK